MRILFVTDLHGNRDRYRRAEELALREGVAAVLNGGDMLPGGKSLHRAQAEFIEGDLAAHMKALGGAGIHFLGLLGNDDLRALDGLFKETCARFPTAHALAGKKVDLGGYEFIGFNLVADYPFRLKDRCRRDSEGFRFPPQLGTGILSTPLSFREIPDWEVLACSLPTLEEELDKLPAPSDPSRAVYAIHMPPSGVGLDQCGDGRRVGSRAVHGFIRKVQPRMTLHGHIHESPEMTRIWCNRIGRTVVIQPGSRPDLAGVLIDLMTSSAVLKAS